MIISQKKTRQCVHHIHPFTLAEKVITICNAYNTHNLHDKERCETAVDPVEVCISTILKASKSKYFIKNKRNEQKMYYFFTCFNGFVFVVVFFLV